MTTLTVKFENHTASVQVTRSCWSKAGVSMDDTLAQVKSIDGRDCLDVAFNDGFDTYQSLCEAALAAARNVLGDSVTGSWSTI